PQMSAGRAAQCAHVRRGGLEGARPGEIKQTQHEVIPGTLERAPGRRDRLEGQCDAFHRQQPPNHGVDRRLRFLDQGDRITLEPAGLDHPAV
nr:hypothetical protein [Tanacetum cinerariifolium]